MNVYAKKSINNQREYYQQLSIIKNIIPENITVNIEKQRYIGYLNIDNPGTQFLENISENLDSTMEKNNNSREHNINLNGFIFNEIKNTEDKITSNFDFMLLSITHGIGIQSEIWTCNDKVSNLLIPLTPLLCWNFKCTLDEILKIKKYSYRIGCFSSDNSTDAIISSITSDINIPYDVLPEMSLDVAKYNYILYYGNTNNNIDDIYILIFCKLVGCHILYCGDYNILNIVNSLFTNETIIQNISGWNRQSIIESINKLTNVTNKRSQYTNTYKYLLPNTLERLINNIPKNNSLQYIFTILDGNLNTCLDTINNHKRCLLTEISLIYDELIDYRFSNWSLIVPSGTLSIYQYLLSNIVLKNLKGYLGNLPDIITIPILDNSTNLANFKISVNSTVWDLENIDNISFKLPFLVKNVDILKIIKGSQYNIDTLSSLINIKRIYI